MNHNRYYIQSECSNYPLRQLSKMCLVKVNRKRRKSLDGIYSMGKTRVDMSSLGGEGSTITLLVYDI